jgi:hypothetical protein
MRPMNKSELQQNLIKQYSNFTDCINSLTDKEVEFSFEGKWSPGKQADHLVRSVAPVRFAFTLPSFFLKIFFGTSNRPSRKYDELVARYHTKLQAGGRASGRFLPNEKPMPVLKLTTQLTGLIKSLNLKIDSFSEEQLDKLILPHPLLGKLTLREMLYFTIYHVQHHHQQVLANKSPSI